MNWEAIAAVGQLVGALAVLVTLIYLAVQIKQKLAAQGGRQDRIDQLRIPAGIEIGSDTPDEIAVSIAAELIRETSAKLSTARDGSPAS